MTFPTWTPRAAERMITILPGQWFSRSKQHKDGEQKGVKMRIGSELALIVAFESRSELYLSSLH